MESDKNEQRLVVLVVDDDEKILKVYERMFRNNDFDLVMTTNPEESIGLVERCRLAVVLSDYQMPKMKGDELLTNVRESYPETTRILISGSHLLVNGLAHYSLLKPSSGKEIIGTVRKGIEEYLTRCETKEFNLLR